MNDSEGVSEAVRKSGEGVVVEVMVRPGSKDSGLTGYDSWRKRFEIKVKAQPRQGKANEEVKTVIADLFDISSGNVEIMSGLRSINKSIMIRTVPFDKVRSVLSAVVK